MTQPNTILRNNENPISNHKYFFLEYKTLPKKSKIAQINQ